MTDPIKSEKKGAGSSVDVAGDAPMESAALRLMASCKAMDLQGVLAALREGAHPNGLMARDGLPKASEVPLIVLCMEELLMGSKGKKKARESRKDEKVAIAKALIDAGADPVARHHAFEPKEGLKPIVACALIRAAAANHTGLVKLLAPYGKGARMVLSRSSKKGETAFLIAASHGNMEACRVLAPLSDTDAHMNDGSRDMRADALTLLSRSDGISESDMIEAIESGWGDPNRRSNSGWRLPTRLVQRGWFGALDSSAKRGPLRLDEVDRGGNSLMSTAVLLHEEEVAEKMVDWLLSHGAKPDAFNSRGTNAVSQAINLSRYGPAKRLMQAGADPCAAGKDMDPSEKSETTAGLSALSMLCLFALDKDASHARALFDWVSKKPEWIKPSGRLKLSPLNCAAINRDAEMGAWLTRRLLELGADPNEADLKNEQTPLMHAMGKQNAGIIAALLPVSNLKQQCKTKLDAHGVAQWLAESGRPLAQQMLQSHLEAKELSEAVRKSKGKAKINARSATL